MSVSQFLEIGVDHAAALVGEQFPQWADLPLTRVVPGGSDHVIFRLGDTLAARFPRHPGAVDQARHESRWLPQLAPHLPLAIPEPVAVGEPAQRYPWHWSVQRWLDGDPVTPAEYGDSVEAARTLAAFVTALQTVPVDDPPRPSTLPLVERDDATRQNIAAVARDFDPTELTRVWSDGLDAPTWHGRPVLFHGDFHTGNLLAENHRITTVIDFGGFGTGDPANDLMMAFTLFSPGPRKVFREALGTDDPTWQRARAWALTTGLTAYTAYAATRPEVRESTTRQIRAAVAG